MGQYARMQNNLNFGALGSVEKEPQSPSAFIDEKECLRRVPVSRRTWFSWRSAGTIPTVKVGHRCIYHWPSVEAALLRMQRGGDL
jgi:hypothetical protein